MDHYVVHGFLLSSRTWRELHALDSGLCGLVGEEVVALLGVQHAEHAVLRPDHDQLVQLIRGHRCRRLLQTARSGLIASQTQAD